MIRRLVLTTVAAATLAGLAACGDTSDGGTQEAGGTIKEVAGSVTGDEDLKKEGQKDQTVGNAKQAVEGVKDSVKDAVK